MKLNYVQLLVVYLFCFLICFISFLFVLIDKVFRWSEEKNQRRQTKCFQKNDNQNAEKAFLIYLLLIFYIIWNMLQQIFDIYYHLLTLQTNGQILAQGQQ